ncbi:hypothetical protein KZZ52_34020 [Dactylosporangium sp. AC04546]|uniref:hypothetical protein n=1 Tax=Dactylosporangium sp. AC04546 TaxID=2862460 RepID=UPI001EDEAECE|nr:hypothetical protein [Dactylosporangium sp. AC04546]WVK78990.1 hypothetical protein KZZ52_34020 [Dactylosporangium sp. AC04546]
MFKEGWLLGGLVASVLLRGAVWLFSFCLVGPVLGPLDLVLAVPLTAVAGHDGAVAIWVGEAVAGIGLAVVTGLACDGLRRDQLWAWRLGLGLARCYVVLNAVTALGSVALVLIWGWWVALVGAGFYLASLAAAALAWRDLASGPRVRVVTGLATLRRLAADA